MVLAQAVLHIWAAQQGVKAFTALDIALYFEIQDEWTRALEDQWNRIGLGLPFSPRLREASSSFFTACATRARAMMSIMVAFGQMIIKRNIRNMKKRKRKINKKHKNNMKNENEQKTKTNK